MVFLVPLLAFFMVLVVYFLEKIADTLKAIHKELSEIPDVTQYSREEESP